MPLENEFLLAALAVVLAGVLRGFSGFGAGMVLVPSLSLIFDPVVAVITVVVLEMIPAIQLLPSTISHCHWRSVLPMSLAAIVTVPLGSFVLVNVDETTMHYGISILVLSSVMALATGWRYTGTLVGNKVPIATGVTSGLISGATSLGGLPVILFYLSGMHDARTARASIVAFLFVTAVVAMISYLSHGIVTVEIFTRCLMLAPIFVFGIWMGQQLFGKANELVFRTVALLVLGSLGLVMLVS